MALNYAWEKLYSACSGAVGSSETPQQRLASAVSAGLIHLKSDDFPNSELWERLKKLVDSSSSEPALGDEGTIAATTSKMSDEDASNWLREMFSIFCDVAEESGRLEGAPDA